MLSYPPALFPALIAALERQEAKMRVNTLTDLLMAGESDWGSSSKYIGKTAQPKSEYEYSNAALRAHLAELQREAGIAPAVVDEATIEREHWKALRSARRIQA